MKKKTNTIQDNELIANYMGYKHIYHTEEDFSDIGGLYTPVTYYSKIPLVLDPDGGLSKESRVCGENCPYIMVKRTIYSIDTNAPNGLQYHCSYDWLMPVYKKLQQFVDQFCYNPNYEFTEAEEKICEKFITHSNIIYERLADGDDIIDLWLEITRFIKCIDKHNTLIEKYTINKDKNE